MKYRVKEVADLAGVSVRTLHHYDEIGLLKPASISPSGYRLYSDENLHRLQQILFFKEIGFELLEIKSILDHPGFDRTHALRSHRALLMAKKQRIEEMIQTLDKTLDEAEGGTTMARKEMFEGFDMSEIERHMDDYADEVRERYDQKIVDESIRKTSKYTKDDWAVIMEKSNEIYRRLVALMNQGAAHPEVQKAIADHRQHITDYFYDCTLEIYRGLGDLYVADARFTANIDKHGEGLAQFLSEAIRIYCDTQE